MRTYKITFIVLTALVLLLGACTPVAQPEQPRTLSVNGNARVMAEPDIAYISIGVHTENESAAQAVADNNTQAQQIAEALTAAGVAAEDIQTQGFNIYPQDEWGPQGERIGTRFIVDNTVYVTLRDLSSIGDVLAAVVDAGANSVFGIQFDLEDKSELVAEARKLAVENATQQAQELAEAAGVELGSVQNISYYNTIPPVPLMDNKVVYGTGGAQEAAAGIPISSGQIVISADVSVSYILK